MVHRVIEFLSIFGRGMLKHQPERAYISFGLQQTPRGARGDDNGERTSCHG